MLKRQEMSKIFPRDYPISPVLRMHECGQDEYWFYHKDSFPYGSPLLYDKLINTAVSEIIIWDPYFNVKFPNRDQNIFANINNGITIKILTLKGLDGGKTYLTEVQNALKMIIPKTKNCRFGLRVINKGDLFNQGKHFFHDRFLIIDDSEVYLIGSSVGHHIKSEQSTGIFKVSNDKTKDFIKSIFKYYWRYSTQNQIQVTFLHL